MQETFAGNIEVEGVSYPFRGTFTRPERETQGGRFVWNAEVDGLNLQAAEKLVALPLGYPGIGPRMATVFVQDYFQGLVRLHRLVGAARTGG